MLFYWQALVLNSIDHLSACFLLRRVIISVASKMYLRRDAATTDTPTTKKSDRTPKHARYVELVTIDAMNIEATNNI